MKLISGQWLAPFLTALGKRWKFDAHYFAKNSFFVMVGQGLSIVRGMVTGYLVTRFFATEIYGQYQFILSVMGMLSIFSFGGIATAVSRAWSRSDRFSLNAITKYQARICLIGSLCLLGCIPVLHVYNRQSLWLLFLAAAIIFPLPPLAMTRFPAYAIGKGRFDLSLQASFVWSILMIVSTLAIIFFRQSAVLMLLVSTLIPPLVYLWYGRHIRSPQELPREENTKRMIRYGWHLTCSTLPVEIVWYIDRLLISHTLGLGQLATFSVAMLIPEQVKVLMKQFLPVSFSKQSAHSDTRETRAKLNRVVLIGVATFAVGIAAYVLMCPFVIPMLFPLYDATQVVSLTSVAAITLIVQPMALFTQYMEAQGMVREIWISNIAAAIVFLMAMIVLIPGYGLMGAVIARGIFRTTNAGLAWWYAMHSPLRTA